MIKSCVKCAKELKGRQVLYCGPNCKASYARSIKSTTKYEKECQRCGDLISPPQRRFCSAACKNSYNHKKGEYTHAKKYYSRTPRNFLQSLMQKKRKKREELCLDFLNEIYYVQEGLCAISGVPMTFKRGEGKVSTNISIDRINSKIGYTKENTQLVCYAVNIMKNTLSEQELLTWCEKILKQGKKSK